MKNRLLLILLLCATVLQAKEGMWIPTLLEAVEDDMKAFGCELDADDIYSINHSSLKDAIVHFDLGCTAEVISDQGLILTNHHCGYGQIQSHSSVENDYLKNGFWAYSLEEELPNPGTVAVFIEEIMDVTSELLPLQEDPEAFKSKAKSLVDERIEGTKLEAVVRAFNYGNSYFMIVTKTFKDVRLVGAPPSAVGKFGGDTDNWVWPRHTGDFSMFRIYADENNEPAEYSESNQPYEPKRHLEINVDGVEEGDFTMVFGFPGRTQQHLISNEVEDIVNRINPMRLDMRSNSLSIIDAAMASSDKTRIQYAAKQSRISNAYKKWIGQNQGLRELGAIDKKLEEEKAYLDLSDMKGRTENVASFERIQELVEAGKKESMAREVFVEYFYYGPEVLRFANAFRNLVDVEYATTKEEEWNQELEQLRSYAKGYFKDYDVSVDERLFFRLTSKYMDYCPEEYQPQVLKDQSDKTALFTYKWYEKSVFTSEERLNKMLDDLEKGKVKKWSKKANKDPLFTLANQVSDSYWKNIRGKYNEKRGEVDALMQDYVAQKMDLFPNKTFWADANSTLRLTFGKAEGSSPKDGMTYNTFTTTDGILQKYIPGDRDFDLPADLVDLLKKRDFGMYADEDGTLKVCFTGSNHTTGGNSGSPALDSKGRLIGLNFDRTWESTMSDIMFDASRCRNIMVDIRYVLWIIDKYAGAQNLIDELSLVKGEEHPEMEVSKEEIIPAE